MNTKRDTPPSNLRSLQARNVEQVSADWIHLVRCVVRCVSAAQQVLPNGGHLKLSTHRLAT